jgi:endonuclease YncB( thermonuclease family)
VSVGDELAPVHLPALQASAAGPVVVRVVAGPAATYRGTGAPSSVRLVAVGTPESVSDSARSIATVGFVMALAIVALACAPLAVVT